MGLDMNLYRRNKNCNIDDDRGEEVMYWRKANQIRQWFVDHTGYPFDADCVDHPLTEQNLIDLLHTCQEVLKDHKSAPRLLPTSNGFFFGTTEYDEWYFSNVESTVTALRRILLTTDFNTQEIYYREWW